jgi:hypothetical protein
MSFRDFTFPEVCDRFGLTLRQAKLFEGVKPASVSPDTRDKLEKGLRLSQGLHNEKARSEFVVAPLLLDVWSQSGERFGLFSGTEMNVDPQQGLNGVCDFLFARDPLVFVLRAPLLAVVEAKNDNVWNGFGQCVATMYAAHLLNEKGGSVGPVYGASTTGRDWKFFHLAGGTLTIDTVEYALMTQVEQVAGILLNMV